MHSIGEVSRRSGVHIETIRYYERQGILPAPARTRTGRRVYDSEGLKRLRFVRKCRDLGFSMSDARALLHLATAGSLNCGEAKPIAEMHVATVEARIGELERLRAALVELIGQCRDPDADCPILQAFLDPDELFAKTDTKPGGVVN